MSSTPGNPYLYVRVFWATLSDVMSTNVRLPILVQIPSDSPSDGHADTRGADADESDLMQVGDLAKEAGKTVRAIHLYEELNLLKPAARSKGRYRLYNRDALTRI